MTLAGFMAFLDPPKESARPALQALREQGVAVKIVTGDNEVVARRVCEEVGLEIQRVLLGPEIDQLSDEELARVLETANLIAKVAPAAKARVVRALQSRGEVVGFLGDGINNSPALRQADVGISVITAVDIAKESADIVLLEKSLLVLEEGVLEGRRTFGNILKHIRMGTSSNFGNMFSVLGVSVWLPFLPMLPVQLLVQNLLDDVSQIGIPFDNVDEEYRKKPRRWQAQGIARFMLYLGPVSSIFDYATFLLMWFLFSANSVEKQSLFQSAWFVEGLLSQTLIVHVIHTRRIPLFEGLASRPLLATTGLVVIAGLTIPFTGLGARLGMQPLPVQFFPWLGLTLVGYGVLAQLMKRWYDQRFGYYE